MNLFHTTFLVKSLGSPGKTSAKATDIASLGGIDETALQDAPLTTKKYPAPSPSLLAVVNFAHYSFEDHMPSVNSSGENMMSDEQLPNETADYALPHISHHDEEASDPSTRAGSAQPPSTYAGTTQPPSTYAGTTQSPSTKASTAQNPYYNNTDSDQSSSSHSEQSHSASVVAGNTPVESVFANTAKDASVEDIDLSSEGMNAAETIRASCRTKSRRINSFFPSDASAEVHESEQNADASQRWQKGENDPKARELKQLFTYLNRLTVKQE